MLQNMRTKSKLSLLALIALISIMVLGIFGVIELKKYLKIRRKGYYRC